MPYADGHLCQRILFTNERSGITHAFESQQNIPRMGEHVAIYDNDGCTMLEGKVINVKWVYLQESNDSACLITLT